MRRVAAEVRRCARLRAPVLLQGESGSGKDVVARAIHRLARGAGPYVPINVGAIPDTLADAELFGHKRGAFTGAVATRAGAFEEAHGGTLFLDEVAELSPGIQVKLLRVVEDGLVRPVGGNQPREVDVRIVSATWAALHERVAAGQFREDLYHRLSTFVVRLPPLRTRKSDIPALARALMRRIEQEVGPKTLTSPALGRLIDHTWPGNVRELGSVLYRAAVSATGEEIHQDDVEAALDAPSKARPRALSEREARALLAEHQNNVSAAARTAGVPRSTFRSWIEK
jgi:DNA-binding NtrC family response regulator